MAFFQFPEFQENEAKHNKRNFKRRFHHGIQGQKFVELLKKSVYNFAS